MTTQKYNNIEQDVQLFPQQQQQQYLNVEDDDNDSCTDDDVQSMDSDDDDDASVNDDQMSPTCRPDYESDVGAVSELVVPRNNISIIDFVNKLEEECKILENKTLVVGKQLMQVEQGLEDVGAGGYIN